MLRRAVGIVATSALGAGAFLIPANIVTPPHHELPSRPPPSLIPFTTEDQSIRVPCSDCVFYTKEEDIEKVETQEDLLWIQGGANDVVLRFTVSPDGRTLRLADQPIYPISMTSYDESFYFDQVPASAEWFEIINGDAKATSTKSTRMSTSSVENTGSTDDVIITIVVNIHELENVPVTIDPVMVRIIRTGEGELLIMHVEIVKEDMEEDTMPYPALQPFEAHHERPHQPAHHEECGALPALLCRMRNMIKSKIAGPPRRKGGCHKHKPDHEMMAEPELLRGPPHFRGNGKPHDFEGPRRPHHGHRHHGGRHHHRGHHMMHGVLAGITAALIPTLAGVVVGVTVSVIGLAVARVLACAWITLVHGRRHESIRLEDDAPADEENGKVYMDGEEVEPLPVYEDAPAYEETEKKEQA